jgi:hypothetical protein
MARLLVFVLALATLGYLAYYAMYNGHPGDDTQLPQTQLKNVRDKAHDIEKQAQQRVDDLANQAEPE